MSGGFFVLRVLWLPERRAQSILRACSPLQNRSRWTAGGARARGFLDGSGYAPGFQRAERAVGRRQPTTASVGVMEWRPSARFRRGQNGSRASRAIAQLYPICRSLTGDGVRETLGRLGTRIPLEVHEIPSGTRASDWTVPPEWNIRHAYIKDPSGKRVVSFSADNLYVMGDSVPVRRTMRLRSCAITSSPCQIVLIGSLIALPTTPRTGVLPRSKAAGELGRGRIRGLYRFCSQ